MSPQQNNTPVEFKLLQRSVSYDLNVMLLHSFYLMKFVDEFETVLGEDELFDKSTAIEFEKSFIKRCFYCGCITAQSGVDISYFIIRKASLADLFIQMKQQFRNVNMLKQACSSVLKAVLNGLEPSEHILVYDDSNGNFIKLSQSITNERIMQFVESFIVFNILGFFRIDNPNKRPDSLNDLYDAIKGISRNVNVRLFYTVGGYTCTQSARSSDIIFCTKKHRMTYHICATTPFIRTIKDKAPKKYKPFKPIFDFVGL